MEKNENQCKRHTAQLYCSVCKDQTEHYFYGRFINPNDGFIKWVCSVCTHKLLSKQFKEISNQESYDGEKQNNQLTFEWWKA